MASINVTIRYRDPVTLPNARHASGIYNYPTKEFNIAWAAPDTGLYPRGITFNGRYLFVGTLGNPRMSGQIVIIDPIAETVVRSMSAGTGVASNVFGLTWDGRFLYFLAQNAVDYRLVKYDVTAGKPVDLDLVGAITGSPRGMAFDGRYLYYCYVSGVTPMLVQVDASAWKTVRIVAITGPIGLAGCGVAFDGLNFWIHWDVEIAFASALDDIFQKSDRWGHQILPQLDAKPGPSTVGTIPNSIAFDGRMIVELESPGG